MNPVVSQPSVAHIIMSNWAPSLITILVGGVFASILFPRWQYYYARARSREERKHTLAEDLSRNMRRYISCWNRLRSIAELEIVREGVLSEEEAERKRNFVEARNASRDALLDTLCSIEIYFSENVQKGIDEFITWDDKCSTARVNELPSREEYVQKRRSLLEMVHREISR